MVGKCNRQKQGAVNATCMPATFTKNQKPAVVDIIVRNHAGIDPRPEVPGS